MPVPVGAARPPPTRPVVDDLDAPPLGAPAPSPRGGATTGFSGEAFIDRLGASGSAAPPKRTGFSWREYRELVVTAIIGVLLLAGAIAWRFTRTPDSETAAAEALVERPGVVNRERRLPGDPSPTASPAAAPVAAPVDPAARATPAPEVVDTAPPPSAEPTPVRAAVPMLSVITIPVGAQLEVNGEYVGQSPLIVPAPGNLRELRIDASKEGYERASSSIGPNEGGHFSATLVLVPKQKR